MRRHKEQPFKHFDPELEKDEDGTWEDEWDEVEQGEENKKQIKVNVNSKPTASTTGSKQQNGS